MASGFISGIIPDKNTKTDIGEARMFQWMRDLTQSEKRTMAGCFGGWSLDALDVQIYSFVIPTLLATWQISKGEAGLLGTVTLVVSAFGGWFAGALSDRYGRVRVLQITVLWYAVFTFLCGFAQNFEQLFVLRALQGLGFGAEWSAGAVLMGEMIRDKYRGRAVGFVQSGWAVGWGAAALLYTLLYAILPDATAWRVMFWIGLSPALLVFWIRRTIKDPEVFERAQEPRHQRADAGLLGAQAALPADHDQGGADGDGRTGRFLRAVGLAADLPEDRAASELPQHRLVSADPHLRRLHRLPGRRLSV